MPSLLFTGWLSTDNWTEPNCDWTINSKSKSKSHYDWRSVNPQVLVSSPIWGSWPDIYYSSTLTVLFFWGVLSDERTGLSFVYAVGPRQRSIARSRVPWDLWSYFTVPDLRLPFSSPPTTRTVTVEVFEPASTRVRSELWTINYCWLLII
jgi:hypothetical protein